MSLNLLSLNTYHYRRGGSDAVFFDHDAIFRELGWETAVFCMNHPKNFPSVWDRFFIDEIELGNQYSLPQKIKMAGKIIYSLESRKNLRRLLDIFTPDIAHIHSVYHHISPSVIPLLKEKNIPIVYTAHDLKLTCPAYKMYNSTGVCEKCINNNLLHLILNKCIHQSFPASTLIAIESAIHKLTGIYKNNLSMIIAPSRFFMNKFIEWGWPENMLTYIPNFINTNMFVPNYTPGDYFLYFGRLSSEKGLHTLLEAAGSTSIKLKIAGTGPIEAELKRKYQQLSNVDFLGFRSGDTLWHDIKNSRAVILPSEWYENAPISILESYALGKPVIGARIGGIPEMIHEDETGYTFESGNIHDLAAKVNHVSSLAAGEIEKLGRNATDFVRSTFTRERYTNSMLALYHSLGVPMAKP